LPVSTSEIETLIKNAMPEAKVDVSGDGVHFAASIEAAEFEGLNRVEQHQLVYSALKGKMDGSSGELHALALTTKVPSK